MTNFKRKTIISVYNNSTCCCEQQFCRTLDNTTSESRDQNFSKNYTLGSDSADNIFVGAEKIVLSWFRKVSKKLKSKMQKKRGGE